VVQTLFTNFVLIQQYVDKTGNSNKHKKLMC